MLTALELVGFKSFADKTRFEFPPGITVVVGPNGSGKSNIVDAVKWVLGEQSAKSLRGKEMADVIYKGSASGNRKPFQSAEATLVFDNSQGLLPLDETEVRITRRVYRSGEGEYMANGRPCRLRDVKDLFSGTGVGADAYSLIEQGKVDSLLQASNRERRSIFEEAAGISRFKAKKVETARRLERVETNLVRLADIVDEVEGRLRALRSQATKAQRYKQYSDRLRELRTYVGLKDWRRLTETIDSLNEEIEELTGQIEEENAANTALETNKMVLDAEMENSRQAVLECESHVSQLRELVASRESDIANRRRQCEDLDIEVLELRRRLLTVTSRAGDIKTQEKQEKKLLDVAEVERDEIDARLEMSEKRHAANARQLEEDKSAHQSRREGHMQRMRESASLSDRIGSFRSQLETADETVSRHQGRLEEIGLKHRGLSEKIDTLSLEKDAVENRVGIEREKLEHAQHNLAGRRSSHSRHQQQLAELQSRLVGARERALVLEELERRLEGLSAGVKEVLGRARDTQSGPFADVRGLVADLIRVNIESATLIEAALGKMAQYVVYSGDRFQEFLCRESHTLKGRAGFVRLDVSGEQPGRKLPDLEHQSGVLGRADQFVTTSPEYRPLVERLLAGTWFVKSLSHAMGLHAQYTGARFVTPAGELVEADGSLLVGPGSNSTGLISRRSELRALRMQIDDLNKKIEIEREAVVRFREEIQEGESEVERCTEAARAAESSLYEHAGKLSGAEDRRRRLEEDQRKIESELESAREKSRTVSREMEQASSTLEQMKQVIARTEAVLSREGNEIAANERQLSHEGEIVTAGKIELARGEQRIESHRAALRQFAEARKERSRVISDIRGQIQRNTERISQAQREILAATTETSRAYLDQESEIAEKKVHEQEIARLQQQQAALSERFREIASRLKKLEKQRHTHEMNVNQAQLERDTLAERLRDDYGIELAELLHSQHQIELAPPSAHIEEEVDEVDDDIEEEYEEDDELDDEYDVEEEDAEEEDELDDEYEDEDELDDEYEDEDELDDEFEEAEEEEAEPVQEEAIDPEQQQAEIDREIEDLRHKLATIGSVNMEALAELEELETRYNALSSQYRDLTDARDTLERIISRINNDSRRLFAETLEAISENFRNLFRHVFGGGGADIILEEGVDILEAGIEIVAMPPGKHALNISLLSGGEKAMTAVTLLLAIFQYRPSPFCVLDEVDGPLDEANIGRFINTLQTFLDTTRFVIVTHSKKTMVAANTLYGITMQESGISKKVSVRFDDVGENGEISQEVIAEEEQGRKAA